MSWYVCKWIHTSTHTYTYMLMVLESLRKKMALILMYARWERKRSERIRHAVLLSQIIAYLNYTVNFLSTCFKRGWKRPFLIGFCRELEMHMTRKLSALKMKSECWVQILTGYVRFEFVPELWGKAWIQFSHSYGYYLHHHHHHHQGVPIARSPLTLSCHSFI